MDAVAGLEDTLVVLPLMSPGSAVARVHPEQSTVCCMWPDGQKPT